MDRYLSRVFGDGATGRLIYRILVENRYAQFFATGVVGVGINLATTWILTELVFGLGGYFQAYIIGTVLNLLFNFVVHFRHTFRAEGNIAGRLIGFSLYSFSMALFQAWIVKTITPIIGLEWYLVIIGSVILLFSVVTFLLFKYFIFRKVDGGEGRLPQVLLLAMFSSLILHLTGLLEVISGKGMEILVTGDAIRYVELAEHLFRGEGFAYMVEGGSLIPETFRTPGLPLFLAPFMGVPYGLYVYLFLQTILAATLIPFLVYWIGKNVYSQRAGVIAAWLIALEPQLMFASWSPITEIPFLITVLVAVVLLLSSRDVFCMLCRNLRLALSGIFLGYAVLIRPGNLIPVSLLAILPLGYMLYRKRNREALALTTILVIMLATLLPWQARNERITGVFSLSATGWANVYIDYTASVLSLVYGTGYTEERNKRKEKAIEEFSLDSRHDISSPALSDRFRESALDELAQYPATIAKLETLLLVSYFTNDNYYNQMIRYGFVPAPTDRISPSQVLLREGLSGTPQIWEEMRKQYFVPIVSRLYQFAILILALVGLFRSPRPLAALLFIIIALSAVFGTVLGFGVEARLRIPIMPILFLLSAYALSGGVLQRPSTGRMRPLFPPMMTLFKRIGWLVLTLRLLKNWPSVYVRKFSHEQGVSERLVLRNGLQFEVADKNTTFPIIAEVIHTKVYGDFTDLEGDHPTLIDIGGNIGTSSILAARNVPKLYAYVFEPEPLNFSLLTKNIALNGLAHRITPINMAVAGKAGTRTLYFTKNSGTNSLYEKKGEAVEVKCMTLESVFKTYHIDTCDLLKIDCEGAEYEILYATPDSVYARIKKIILEWHDIEGEKPEDLKAFLEGKGYRIIVSPTHRLYTAIRP